MLKVIHTSIPKDKKVPLPPWEQHFFIDEVIQNRYGI